MTRSRCPSVRSTPILSTGHGIYERIIDVLQLDLETVEMGVNSMLVNSTASLSFTRNPGGVQSVRVLLNKAASPVLANPGEVRPKLLVKDLVDMLGPFTLDELSADGPDI